MCYSHLATPKVVQPVPRKKELAVNASSLISAQKYYYKKIKNKKRRMAMASKAANDKKALTREELIALGILKPAPPPAPTKRIKVPSRTEKPVTVLPPRGAVWYDD